MRSKVIAGLLVVGGFLTFMASGLLIYRALLFAHQMGSLTSAIIGAVLGAASLVLTFKSLGEAGQDADQKNTSIKIAKPAVTVTASFVGTLISIHFAGLSVAEYLQWLANVIHI